MGRSQGRAARRQADVRAMPLGVRLHVSKARELPALGPEHCSKIGRLVFSFTTPAPVVCVGQVGVVNQPDSPFACGTRSFIRCQLNSSYKHSVLC